MTSHTIKYISDLHFEIHGNHEIPSFIKGKEGEILVVAGDTLQAITLAPHRTDAHSRSQKRKFQTFLEQVSGFDKIIFVPGNHEHYNGNIQESTALLRNFIIEQMGLSPYQYYVLDRGFIEIGKDWILAGATLWTDMGKDDPISHFNVARGMNDFSIIQGANGRFQTDDACLIHRQTVDWLKVLVEYFPSKNFIVATHHAPSYQSENLEQFGASPISDGYCSELSDLILDNSNILHWIHGHTHHDVNYFIGQCEIHSFQRGYVAYGEGKSFNKENFDKASIMLIGE